VPSTAGPHLGYNPPVLLWLLTACSEDFGNDAKGGVWLGTPQVQPVDTGDVARSPEIGFLDPRHGEFFASKSSRETSTETTSPRWP
jgi:hypothetical protein